MTALLRNRLAIQSVARASDSQGGFTDTWTTVVTIWASIEPTKAYERFQAMQTATPITHKIKCRYNANITTAKRALFGSRIFDIKQVLNINESNSMMVLLCVEQA
jgi:SPP1 family predicted phage head-tail adaptor